MIISTTNMFLFMFEEIFYKYYPNFFHHIEVVTTSHLNFGIELCLKDPFMDPFMKVPQYLEVMLFA